MEWIPPADIDPEVVSLCRAVNAIKGIRTVSSCCGHGKIPFQIYFMARDLDSLPNLLYWLDACHSGFQGWRCLVYTDCGKSPVTFLIEGPIGAYKEADKIAELILEDIACTSVA